MEKKKKIMEALLSANNNLSKEEIMWAASHLPTTNENGDYGMTSSILPNFKHEASDMFEALSITKEDAEKAAEVMSHVTRDVMCKKEYRFSHAVEDAIKNGMEVNGFFALLVSKTIKDAVDEVQRKSLTDLMKKLKRGDDADE